MIFNKIGSVRIACFYMARFAPFPFEQKNPLQNVQLRRDIGAVFNIYIKDEVLEEEEELKNRYILAGSSH